MEKDLSHILNHLGEDRELYFNSVSPPLMQSSNFHFPTVADMRAAWPREFDAPLYSRGVNPTVSILRKKLAALEGAEDALVFSSGSGAIAAAVMSQVKAGDHLICVQKPYSWTGKLIENTLSQYGITYSMVDGTALSAIEEAICANTKLILLESPLSMTFELQDLRGVAAIAQKRGITTIVDNSYSTPLYQRPLEMGIDLVIHSASKYLNGHSDLVAGVIAGPKHLVRSIMKTEFMTFGACIAPNDAWLILRGLRTLPVRMERISKNGVAIAQFLNDHPRVERVSYPMSPSHPQHALALRQMTGAGGLMGLWLKAETIQEVERFCDALTRFLIAVSWGGHESLIWPVCAWYEDEQNGSSHYPWNLIRVSIGLEDSEALVEDLSQALDSM